LEKCEAAIGVCELNAREVEDYQPEVGAYLVAQFIVELIGEYQKDHPNFDGAKTKEEKDARKIPLIPWRVQSDRLRDALNRLRENLPLKATALREKVQKLINEATPVLTSMRGHIQ